MQRNDTSRRLRTVAHLVDEANFARARTPSRVSSHGLGGARAGHDAEQGWMDQPDGPYATHSPASATDRELGRRPGTGDIAVKSPRSLWRYVESLSTEDSAGVSSELLHGIPAEYASFCRERCAATSRRVFFPPWVQRPEASWEDSIHTFEHHRLMWAQLKQADRKRVLQIPRAELLARATAEGHGSGTVPPNARTQPPRR
jgi:hypothetical protein